MTTRFLLTSSACFAALIASSLASAQTPAATGKNATAQSQSVGEITVTARRRNEALVDVPLAISVVSSAKIEQLGIKNTTDLANYVPGLEFNNYTPGNNRNDRGSGRFLAFRGLLLVGGSSPSSMFLNGAAVVGNEIPASMDIGAVEVLRGPQSVYFGRSTMTGALSYRTKAIPDHLSGEAEYETGQRNLNNFSASIAGPIIDNVLGARLTYVSEKTDGYVGNDYTNGSTKLGDTSRQSLSTTIEYTPTTDLSFKGYFNYFKDDDGPSQTAFVRPIYNNCQLPGATQKTFCGEIPDRNYSTNFRSPYVPALSSAPGTELAKVAPYIFTNPLLSGARIKQRVGGQRQVSNNDLTVNWNLNDYLKFQAISGYHENLTVAVNDGMGQPVGAYNPTPYQGGTGGQFQNQVNMFTFTQKFRDFSQEFRLSSDPERALSWTAGVNYIQNTVKTAASVGNVINAGNNTGACPANTFCPVVQALGTQTTQTYGYFGGVYWKIIPKLTVSAEARYQQDKRGAISQSMTTGVQSSNLSSKFYSVSPRVAIDYALDGKKKIYASYATGTRPGGFNTGILSQVNNAAAYAEILAKLGGAGVTFKEDKLRVAELGFKGEFDGGNGYFDVNTYIGKLLNQQVNYSAVIFAPPLNGNTVSGTANVGEGKIHGVEFQGNYSFTRALSVNTTFAWNYAEHTLFKQPTTAALAQFGTQDFSGTKFANVPELSGSVVGTYSTPWKDNWNSFSNVAVVYRGKQFVDVKNASWIKARFQTDVRTGIENGTYTLEAYVKNVFNNQDYTGGGLASDFGGNTGNSFFGGWAPPRQFGVRMRVKF